MKRCTLLVCLFALLPFPVEGQVSATVHWRLVDFLIRADSGGEIVLVASPNASSKQGTADTNAVSWLHLLPVDVAQWAAHVKRVVDSIGLKQPSSEGVIHPLLASHDSGGTLGVGVLANTRPWERFFVLLSDPKRNRGWRANGARAEVDSLLRAMRHLAEWVLRPGSPIPRGADSVSCRGERELAREEPPDREPFVTVRSRTEAPSNTFFRDEMVWVSFVVDTLGRAESKSLCLLLPGSRGFNEFVRQATLEMQFEPAVAAGRRVRRLVFQPFLLTIRRR